MGKSFSSLQRKKAAEEQKARWKAARKQKGATGQDQAKDEKLGPADFNETEFKAALVTYQPRAGKAGESKRINGKWRLIDPNMDTMSSLCRDRGAILNAMRAVKQAGNGTTMKVATRTNQRRVTMHPTLGKKIESASVAFKSLSFSVDKKARLVVNLSFTEAGTQDTAAFYYDHLDCDLRITTNIKQADFDFKGPDGDQASKDEKKADKPAATVA